VDIGLKGDGPVETRLGGHEGRSRRRKMPNTRNFGLQDRVSNRIGNGSTIIPTG